MPVDEKVESRTGKALQTGSIDALVANRLADKYNLTGRILPVK